MTHRIEAFVHVVLPFGCNAAAERVVAPAGRQVAGLHERGLPGFAHATSKVTAMKGRVGAMVSFRAAVPAIAATLASFFILYALCLRVGSNPSPAILAATLIVGLTRAPETLAFGTLVRRVLLLPVVAFAATLVGAAFLHAPAIGATLFTLGMATSVALRQFGNGAAAIGRAMALTLIAMLVVPVPLDRSVGGPALALLVVAAGVVAQLCAWTSTIAGQRLGLVRAGRARIEPVRPRTAGVTSPSTRMAAQMLAALALAFAIGMLAFWQHWPWVVLSAFIICSGAIGRGDALYKALLRIGGAIGGTFVAAFVGQARFANSIEYAALVFLVLFLGLWLRQINYAYWAACMTLIFALLQGTEPGVGLFGTRVLCIVIGAACGVAATWFVFPIRTRHVVRRRIADAMGAMRDVLGGADRSLDHHAAELDRVAPPLKLHRTVARAHDDAAHPANWIERTRTLLDRMRAPGFDRKDAGAELRRLRTDVFGETLPPD